MSNSNRTTNRLTAETVSPFAASEARKRVETIVSNSDNVFVSKAYRQALANQVVAKMQEGTTADTGKVLRGEMSREEFRTKHGFLPKAIYRANRLHSSNSR